MGVSLGMIDVYVYFHLERNTQALNPGHSAAKLKADLLCFISFQIIFWDPAKSNWVWL